MHTYIYIQIEHSIGESPLESNTFLFDTVYPEINR